MAHVEMPTLVLAKFEAPGEVRVRLDLDLTLLLGSPEAYYAFVGEPEAVQQSRIRELLPRIAEDMSVLVGDRKVDLMLDRFSAAKGDRAEFVGDTSTGKRSTFEFTGALPKSSDPIRLKVARSTFLELPITFSAQVPAKRFSVTRWMVGGMRESDPIDWANAPSASRDPTASGGTAGTASGDEVSAGSWLAQFPTYLYLGFRHIVPEGADHILFVLGLFFLGISWRKLLSQTTVFTVAHATTLFLSSYGFFRLPPAYIEPAIAISIAVVALENVFRPKLGPGRLAIVFAFGLVHGLGFAASIQEVPFPENDFLMALLGFNLGVDFGQLFVIAIAFVAVGWFRKRPWYGDRIAIPASLLIAAIGVYWAVERLIVYAPAYRLSGAA
jgi:hypothetical protein